MKVKIYTTSWCAYCKAEKAWLDQQGVAYEQVMADEDEAKAAELQEASGGQAVPFTIVTKDDGSTTEVLGFDQPKLAAALGIA